MRGINQLNFPAFDAAEDYLRSCGLDVISPAQLDRAKGFDPARLPSDFDWNTSPEGFDMAAAIDQDIAAVRECDAVYRLSGWENSKGARAEKALAEWMGKRVDYQDADSKKPPDLGG